MAVIGPAEEFWRVRVTRVDADSELDLEWRDDLLYRAPAQTAPSEESVWLVEAVRLDDDEVFVLGEFESEDDAREFFEAASEDIRDLTSNQFMERYDCG